MSDRIIPLVDARRAIPLPDVGPLAPGTRVANTRVVDTRVVDTSGRPLRDLRISVTDRCNFRCPYCMPAEIFGDRYEFLPKPAILSFEEIERLARQSA